MSYMLGYECKHVGLDYLCSACCTGFFCCCQNQYSKLSPNLAHFYTRHNILGVCKYVGVWYEILDFYALQATLTILAKEFQTLLVAWILCRIPAKLNGFIENISFGKFD